MKKILLLVLVLFSIDFSVYCQRSFQSGSRWISASSGLRMRDQPNLIGKKLDVIPYGERVNWMAEKDETVYLAGTFGKWTKVKWGDNLGWVFGGFLSKMHPDKAAINTEALSTFYSDKWENDLSLCRVDLDGYGFTLKKDGSIREGEFEYDITKFYRYEKGISVSINEGYEWGGTSYEFDAKMYTLEEIFSLACNIYSEKYKQYLDTKDNQLVLPMSNEDRSSLAGYTNVNFQSRVEEGAFKSFRIEETDGCGEWFYFEIQQDRITFGDGNGC